MPMHRLFAAVRPPADIRNLLLELMGGVANARWQDDSQLHLTLRFIGEVDRHSARDIHAALGSVRQQPFDVAVDGLGTFVRKGEPHTLWAGIAPHAPVGALHNKVDQAVARVGVPPDRRAFHPHITLARINRSAGPVHDFLARSGGVRSPAFTVDAFGLFDSQLTPGGAVYTQVEAYPLS